MRGHIAFGVAAALMVATVARADVPDGGACERAPDRAHAGKVITSTQALMQAASGRLQGVQDLDVTRSTATSVRAAAAMLACDEPAFSGKQLQELRDVEGIALKWADSQDRRIGFEEDTRSTVVVPLCQAAWARDSALAAIAQEKANPSGVVDLKYLHGEGEALQYARAQVAALTPAYVAARHHAFTRWEDEGACVAAANEAQAAQ